MDPVWQIRSESECELDAEKRSSLSMAVYHILQRDATRDEDEQLLFSKVVRQALMSRSRVRVSVSDRFVVLQFLVRSAFKSGPEWRTGSATIFSGRARQRCSTRCWAEQFDLIRAWRTRDALPEMRHASIDRRQSESANVFAIERLQVAQQGGDTLTVRFRASSSGLC